MRWEYKAVQGPSLAGVMDELTALGAAEWEAVGVVEVTVQGAPRGVEVLLKRVGKSGQAGRHRDARGRLAEVLQRGHGAEA